MQSRPWLFSFLSLWLRSVDPFSYAQIVAYTEISMPTKSGCFSFQVRDFVWNAPAVGSGPQVELDFSFLFFFFTFTQELQGICTGVTIRWHQKDLEFSTIIASGKLLVPSCIYVRPSYIITVSPALPTSFLENFPQHSEKEADNFWATKSSCEEDAFLLPLCTFVVPSQSFPFVLTKIILQALKVSFQLDKDARVLPPVQSWC